MDEGNATQIHLFAINCKNMFADCVAHPASKEHDWIRSSQGDFNLWHTGMKATYSDKSSLDHRLRGRPDVRKDICDLLRGLIQALNSCQELLIGSSKPPDDYMDSSDKEQTEEQFRVNSDSPVSWEGISIESDGSEIISEYSHDPLMSECLSCIQGFLSQLVRISLAIRKSGNKHRFRQVDAELDKRLEEGAYSELRRFFTTVILKGFEDDEAKTLTTKLKITRSSDATRLNKIQERLIYTNLVRRQRIDHMIELRASENFHDAPIEIPERVNSNFQNLTTQVIDNKKISEKLSPDVAPRASSITAPQERPKTEAAFTATDIGSKLDIKPIISRNPSSTITRITRKGVSQAYPRCPDLDVDGSLRCPYCNDALPSSYSQDERKEIWKKHVSQDLVPYTCMADDCDTPNEMYLTSADLSNHMFEKHSVMRWRCDFCSFDVAEGVMSADELPVIFDNAGDWVSHIAGKHVDNVLPNEYTILSEANKLPMLEPMPCPLCEHGPDGMVTEIDDHILDHLHEFSLMALPESVGHQDHEQKSQISPVTGVLSHTKLDPEDQALIRQYPDATFNQVKEGLDNIWRSLLYSQELANPMLLNKPPHLNLAAVELWKSKAIKTLALLEASQQHNPYEKDWTLQQDNLHEEDWNIHRVTIRIEEMNCAAEPISRLQTVDKMLYVVPAISSSGLIYREEILDDLKSLLFDSISESTMNPWSKEAVLQSRVALVGREGVGKTSIAWTLAHRLQDASNNRSVFWVDAGSESSAQKSYEAIMTKLCGDSAHLGRQEMTWNSTRDHLHHFLWNSNTPWLVIIDGLQRQTASILSHEDMVPHAPNGAVLFTTSDPGCLAILGPIKSIEVPDLDEEINMLSNSIWPTNAGLDRTHIHIPSDVGGLLAQVLENRSFEDWLYESHEALLWIKGDSGTGKTMLLNTLIDHLDETLTRPHNLVYFFCRASDGGANNSTDIVRGLTRLLISEQPLLISHVRKECELTGSLLIDFTDATSAFKIMANILEDPNLQKTYILIDGLDECPSGLSQLLDLINYLFANHVQVKWLVCSRHTTEIAHSFKGGKAKSITIQEFSSQPPLRILSLDGGGIGDISNLLILETIMKEIGVAMNLDHIPRPRDYFDLVGGIGTGGIIAIMIGRLDMTVDECIRAYGKLAAQAFTPKPVSFLPTPAKPAFSAKALEDAMKQIVTEYCMDIECVTRRRKYDTTVDTCPHSNMAFQDHTCKKTAVLAISKDTAVLPTLFKTYGSSTAFAASPIWQIARATSAAAGVFNPIKVGRDQTEFLDTGFRYNNPCEILVHEAQQEFPERTNMQILSIGSLGDVLTTKDERSPILDALKKMAASSEKIARQMDNLYDDSGEYHRFNAAKGLEDNMLWDWKHPSKVSAHTGHYLRDNERAIQNFVDDFMHRSRGSGDETLPNTPCHMIPFSRNHRFVGHGKELEALKKKFSQKESRRLAIFGREGVGKTQVALELAYWVKEHMPSYSIFWMSGSSNATFEQSCMQITMKLGVITLSFDDRPRNTMKRHLGLESTGPWFLIVDDADEMDLLFGDSGLPGRSQNLPESENGIILLIIRSHNVAELFAGNGITKIEALDLQEATTLLRRSLDSQVLSQDEQEMKQLVNKLNHLPLAIIQAAAYIKQADITIFKYLILLHNTKGDALNQEFHNATVATTWLVSFQQIQRAHGYATDLLLFISCIEPSSIPRSLLSDLVSEEETIRALDMLCEYAFLNRRKDGSYDMHNIVHHLIREWVSQNGYMNETLEMAVRHISKAFPSDEYTNHELRRAFLPHSLRALQKSHERDTGETEERSALYIQVGRCLKADGRFREALTCFKETCRLKELHSAEDDPSQLESQHELAIAYYANDQVGKAIELFEHVVAVRGSLDEDHPNLLASQYELAMAYQYDGQVRKAVKLLEHVVTMEASFLAEDDLSRLSSQHRLAMAYQYDGQIGKAVKLLEHVVAVKAECLAEADPSQLSSQDGLAMAYQDDGQIGKAIDVLEHVVAVRGSLAEEHPDLLASQHGLAMAYQDHGQVGKAIELLEHVVAVRGSLAEEHPDLLASQYELAMAYQDHGQVGKAIELLEHVVAVRGSLAEEHPDLLASQHGLAMAYQDAGQIGKAVKLLEHVVTVEAGFLAEDDLARLSSQHGLAMAYQYDGQIGKAVKLLEHIVAVKAECLAEADPSRLSSQDALAAVKQAYEENRSHQG